MPVISLPDEFSRESNLSRMHYGICVDNADPKQIGRIRAIVPGIFESDDFSLLPWVYPMEGELVRGDYGSFRVPDMWSQVIIEFGQNDVYTPYYRFSNPNPNTVSQIIRDFDGADTKDIILFHAWTTPTNKANWIRVDKEKNTLQLFMGDAPTYFQIDVQGNIQVQTPGNVNVTTTSDIGFQARNIVLRAKDGIALEAGRDITETAKNSIAMKAGKSVGTEAQDQVTIKAGTFIRDQAGLDSTTFVGRNIQQRAGGGIHTKADGPDTKQAGVIVRKADNIYDNEGVESVSFRLPGEVDILGVGSLPANHRSLLAVHRHRVSAIQARVEIISTTIITSVQVATQKVKEKWQEFIKRFKGRKI